MKNINDQILINQIIADAVRYDHIVIDAFAGFGGVTQGFMSTGKFKVIACINHWDKAISTHFANHPDCLHIEEDFRTADLTLLKYMVDKIRLLKPSIQLHGWFSLECTNFSNAKGGMPRDADSRTLADHMDRYVSAFDFDVIWIENVKEFLLWGPMMPKTVIIPTPLPKKKKHQSYVKEWQQLMRAVNSIKDDEDDVQLFESCPLVYNKKKFCPWLIPDPAHKGQDFRRWRKEIEGFGYDSDYRLLNAADYGVPQHRIRLFIQFVRKGEPICWPKPTHDKKGRHGLSKWKAIRTCLDLKDEGTDLLSFRNGKPRIKSPKTIQRLMTGCIKHVLKGKDFFITKYMGNNEHSGLNNGKTIDETSVTVPTSNRMALVKAKLIDFYFGNGYTIPDTVPAGVSGTKDGASVHTVQFMQHVVKHYSGNDENMNVSTDSPSGAITGTGGNASLVTTRHITQNYSGDTKNFPTENPSRAVTGTGGNQNLVTSLFIDQRYTSGQVNKGADEPAGAITGNPKNIVTKVEHFVMDTQFNNETHSLEEVAHTQTANRKHYYIINLQWGDGTVKHIEDPSATVIARMDKCPPYLVVTETGKLALEVYPHDPPHYRAMKKFMAANGIVSIKMRMLKEKELLKIQTLPATYKLTSSSTDNKKMIGNAVPSRLVKHLAMAHYDGWKVTQKSRRAAA